MEMKSAYAASTMCGTSRYSTITGRYPSRSSYGRVWDQYSFVRDVKIPRTKLEDARGVNDPNDCSENNIAALLQRNGYHTGTVGKWHLTSDDGGSYSYTRIQNDIKNCGFDFAEAIYKENMWGDWFADATHNMEHVTSEAMHFIEDAVEDGNKPFFLYFNPTVPHNSGDVTDALQYADCQDTVSGRLSTAPYIPYGMTADFGGDCRAYRQSVLNRGGSNDDKMAGAVWVDDAIGSLLQLLENLNVIHNTFILFQLDHGPDAKGSLFEGGSRIVQFVHYPKLISRGSSFEGLVSTIDVAATLADIAGIPENHRYSMDGKSWKSEVINGSNRWRTFNDRCLFVEEGLDRSIRCGCYKYMLVQDRQNGFTAREAHKVGVSIGNTNFYNLCDEETGIYISAPEFSPEWHSISINASIEEELIQKIECHLRRTNPTDNPNYDKACDGPLDVAPHPDSPQIQPDETITDDESLGDILNNPENPWSEEVDPSPVPVPVQSPTPLPTIATGSPTYRPSIRQTATLSMRPSDGATNSLTTTHLTASPSVGHTALPTTSQPPSFQPVQQPLDETSSPLQSDILSGAPAVLIDESFDLSNSTEYDLDCFDDPEYLYAAIKGNDCRWVIENDRCGRTDPESKLHVGKTYCPESCSFCEIDDGCFDNPYYLWKGEKGYDCAWVEANESCDRVEDADDGSTIHIGEQFCPESCGRCTPDIGVSND